METSSDYFVLMMLLSIAVNLKADPNETVVHVRG